MMLTLPLGEVKIVKKGERSYLNGPLAPIRTDLTKKAHFGNPLADIVRIFPGGDGGLKLSNKV